MTVTADTITDTQILALQSGAGAVGDHRMVDICAAAMPLHAADDGTDSHRLVDGEPWTIDEARAECARVINEARAQEDS
jgi:hypothetical protein